VFMSGATVWFGLYNRSLPKLAIGSITIFGGVLPIDRLVVVLFSVGFVLLLYLFLKGTKKGQAMVASAQSREGAVLRGINPNTMSRITMAIGCALAAGAGTLAGTMSIVAPGMGGPVLLKGFIIIVIGGMGSLLGAVVGGVIMGLVDGVLPISFALGSEEEIEEEQRLFYVAITRAQNRCFLTLHHEGTRGGITQFNKISRFVDMPSVLARIELKETGQQDREHIVKAEEDESLAIYDKNALIKKLLDFYK